LTSSLHAIEESLKRRRENLSSELQDVSGVSESDLQTGDIAGREEVLRREYGLRVDQIGANSPAGERVRQYDVPEDPKLEQLMQDLNELSAKARDTVIIFTQYSDTLDAIKQKVSLSHHGVGTYSGSGGEIYDAAEDKWSGV
ncbi:helicase, partial [Halorubrum sp. SS5]